ncbi:MAG: 5'-nucleotidase [Planctomycetota bacterium]|nr:5'-nucleotidase [Planctomycetota bacterium]
MKIRHTCAFILAAILLCVATLGCKAKGALKTKDATKPSEDYTNEAQQAPSQPAINANWSEVDDASGIDAEIDAIIQPYREKLQAVMDEEIGIADTIIDRGRPESPLGNLIADSILNYSKENLDPETKISLMNRGGIRLPELPAGPITVADIYQLVPFDNRIVVLTLTGSQIESLIQSLADKQGEVISGVVYELQKTNTTDKKNSWTATKIKIGGKSLEPEATYKLATLDYLAGIGDEFAVLQEASERKDGKLFLREIMIKRIRQMKNIPSVLDGRVSLGKESGE